MSNFDIGLLRKAVEWAEEEHARKRRIRKGIRYFLKRGDHTWKQSFWGVARVNERTLKEGTTVYSKPHGSKLLAVNPMTCGTTGCIAGHICVIAGDKYLVPTDTRDGVEIQVDWVLTPEGEVRNINSRAIDLLGGDSETEVGDLFSGGNSITKVREIASRIARDHGEEL